MSETLLDRVLEARTDEVHAMVRDVGAVVVEAGLPAERALKVQLALEEAAVNICRHAYHDRGGPMRVRALKGPRDITVELTDEGDPHDPLEQEPPDLSGDIGRRAVGGMGVHLMRSVTDEVRYERRDDTNVLSLVFELGA